MGSKGKSPGAVRLPPFEQTDLGWLTTLPPEYGTFLGQPIDLLIGDYDDEAARPDRATVQFARKMIAELPKILPQAEAALRNEVKDDPDAWPRNADPVLSFDPECVDTGQWVLGVEAVDNEGGSWDIEFNGTELTGIFPAES